MACCGARHQIQHKLHIGGIPCLMGSFLLIRLIYCMQPTGHLMNSPALGLISRRLGYILSTPRIRVVLGISCSLWFCFSWSSAKKFKSYVIFCQTDYTEHGFLHAGIGNYKLNAYYIFYFFKNAISIT